MKTLLILSLLLAACGTATVRPPETDRGREPCAIPWPLPWPCPIPAPRPKPPAPLPPTDPKPAPPPRRPTQPTAELLATINLEREARGLSELQPLQGLTCAAERHAADIGQARQCRHNGRDGTSPWERAKACNTQATGEIIACGQQTARAAVDAWTKSAGHARIMYDPQNRTVGAAMVGNYWVVLFRKGEP